MPSANRLKPNTGLIFGITMGTAALAAIFFVLARGFLDLRTLRLIIAIAMTWTALQQLIFLFRIRNIQFLVPALTFLTLALANYAEWFEYDTARTVFASIFLPLVIGTLVLLAVNPLAFRSRRILELAARPVTGTEDGYTPRPYPAGDVQASKEEIIRFARDMKRKLIAFSLINRDRVLLAISDHDWKYVFNSRPNPQKTTYAAFDFEGNFSVHIAKKDYRRCREKLTFDELCSSLGHVFERFFDYHRIGEPERIIEELNHLKEKQSG